MAGGNIEVSWRTLIDRVVGECRSALGDDLVAVA
jgi:hypothetical protein